MGRLLSPSGRKLIVENIEKHGLPLIRKERLANNIQYRMELFDSVLSANNYDAIVNIGGGVASLGTSFNLRLLPPGVVRRNIIQDIIRPGGIEGVFSKFLNFDIPGLHILNIRPLTQDFKIPFAPIPTPEIGIGGLYATEKYNIWVASLCLIVVSSSVLVVGIQSKRKIKQHLIQHEPDSLL